MSDRNTAVKFYNQAVASVNDDKNPNRYTHAYQLFASACHTDPTWFTAHFESGNNNNNLNHIEAAVAGWRLALQCEASIEDRAKAYVNLGWRLHSLGRTQEALVTTLKGIKLDPTLHLGPLNLSMVYATLCDRPKMLEAARKAFELAPKEPNAEMALAFALLFDGQYVEGFKHCEARFAWRLQSFLQYPYPRWEGQLGSTIFLVAEQGLGDTLSFARFIPMAAKKCKYMHLYVQPPLLRLFQHAFVGIPNLNLIPTPAPFPSADYWTTFNSLPWALHLDEDEIRQTQQITSPKLRMPLNWKATGKKLHVGIAWSGSPANDIDKYRNIPVTQFFELLSVSGVQLYSLQKDSMAGQIHDAGGAPFVRDLTPYISDVADTCDILRNLDLVICCESALGHIAAVTNTPCWHPYSYMGRDWRLGLSGENMLWRPKSHRVFCQGPDQRWQPVFDEICAELEYYVGKGKVS